jgi:hypothetical protein
MGMTHALRVRGGNLVVVVLVLGEPPWTFMVVRHLFAGLAARLP